MSRNVMDNIKITCPICNKKFKRINGVTIKNVRVCARSKCQQEFRRLMVDPVFSSRSASK